MKKLLAISALALTLFLAIRQPAHNPAGVDIDNYDFPTPAELDSLWRAEVAVET